MRAGALHRMEAARTVPLAHSCSKLEHLDSTAGADPLNEEREALINAERNLAALA